MSEVQSWMNGDDNDEGMSEFRYDTQLLIDGDDLDEDEVFDYISNNFKGDCLLAVGGDGDPIKIHQRALACFAVLQYTRRDI